MNKVIIDDTIGQRCVKLINQDGLEIVAKERSCSGRRDGVSLFLDSYVGCGLRCSYCWLTKNPVQKEVSDDVWEVLLFDMIDELKKHEWAQDRNYFAKFMGQGDPFSNPIQTSCRTDIMLDCFYDNDIVLGGISYSSIFPRHACLKDIGYLFWAYGTTLYPRVYVSVGSFDSDTRRKLFPGAMELNDALSFCSNQDVDLRMHWTPLSSVKNMETEIENCLKMIDEFSVKHVRIIPYNSDAGSKIKAYNDIPKLVKAIRDAGYSCDTLESTGHSIDAACGMFSSKNRGV